MPVNNKKYLKNLYFLNRHKISLECTFRPQSVIGHHHLRIHWLTWECPMVGKLKMGWNHFWWWPIMLCGLKVHSKDILCRLRKYKCLRYYLFINSIQTILMYRLTTKGQIKPKSRLGSHRFSQKTNGQVCIVCLEE